VLLNNEGGTYIDIENVSTGGTAFSISPLDSTTLLPGDSLVFDVIFEPQSVAAYYDTLTIALYYGDDLVVPLSGAGTALGVKDETIIPKTFRFDVFPNPFNPTTAISYDLPVACEVQLTVYEVTGSIVTTLVDGWRNAGMNQVTFDGSHLASGIYIYRLEAGMFTASGKMVLMK
jgi:hypothetical protein